MYIEKEGCYDQNKKTVYLDIDDVLLKSTEKVLEILANTYPEQMKGKGRKDVTQWSYGNLIPGIDASLIFDSNEFLEHVEFDEKVLLVIKKYFDKFNWVFVTKGSAKNVLYKYALIFSEELFLNNEKKIGYYGLTCGEEKSEVDMADGIQVDDYYWNLTDTNAGVKILYRNPETDAEANYNGFEVIDGSLDNLYVCEFADDLENILEFVLEYGLSNDDLLKSETVCC